MPPVPKLEDDRRVYIGIDPGTGGGIAAIVPTTDTVYAYAMPEDEVGVWATLESLVRLGRLYGGTRAVLEQVGGYTGADAGASGRGPGMFNFGVGYGGLRMALTGLHVEWKCAVPQRWQPRVGAPKKGKETSVAEHKNRLKELAQHLFPGTRVTKAVADALLIAHYCRLHYTGKVD